MKLGKITPVLRIFDEAKALEFYVEFLGFKVAWRHRPAADLPLYMAVARDGCELHLTEHHGDCCPGAALRIEISDVERYHLELSAKQYRYARPGVEDMPWGSRELSVSDPFGNRLTFSQPAPSVASPDFKVERSES